MIDTSWEPEASGLVRDWGSELPLEKVQGAWEGGDGRDPPA